MHRIVSSLFKEAEKEKKDKATCIELVCIVSDSETALYSEENPNIVILPNVQYYQYHNEWRNIAYSTVHIHTYIQVNPARSCCQRGHVMVRFKNRYLVFRITWKDGRIDTSQHEGTILQSIREGIASLFGEVALASAMASCQVKYYNPYSGSVLVRSRRDDYRQVWAVVTCMREIQNRVCRFHVHRVSGNVSHAVDAIRHLDDDDGQHRDDVVRGGMTPRAAYVAKLDSIEM